MSKQLKSHILGLVLVIISMGVILYDTQNQTIKYVSLGIILAAIVLIIFSIQKKKPL